MTNYLITGGAGLIGSNLLKELLKNPNNKIKIVDNLWRGKSENISVIENNFDFKKDFFNLDLRNYDNCISVTKNIDTVIHLADVVAGINYVFDNEFSLFQSNLSINSNILAASIKNKVNNYLYVGTACSYPLERQQLNSNSHMKEEDAYPANPESSYGWSKLIGEYEIELANKAGFINSSILRLHNVYGPPCELSNEFSQVIPALCRKLILNEDFIVWGSGKQRRAFVYVEDVVDAIISSIDKGMNKGVIQIGPSESISIAEIAEHLVKISGKKIDIKFDKTKPEGDYDRTADFSKAKEILKWSPKTQIYDGLLKTFSWSADYLAK